MSFKSKLLSIVGICTAFAITNAENRTLFVHHATGIDPILYAEIDSIRFSSIDVDSVVCNIPVTQEIWTNDTVYRYNIADIISTSFEAPATVARKEAVNLEGELAQYIEGLETNEWGDLYLKLSPSTPANLIPEEDQYLYQLNASEKLPNGFAGQVGYVNGTQIECYDAELSDIFDTLVWDNCTSVETEAAAAAKSRADGDADGVSVETGWLAAVNTYPYGPSVVTQMTDELRDIPAGPAEPRITSKIRVRPTVNMWAGLYLLGGKRGDDGEWEELPTESHKIVTTVSTPVEAHVDGRASIDTEHTLGTDNKITITRPFGLGRSFTVTFTGTMKLKGQMGLVYDYKAEYKAKSTVNAVADENSVAMNGRFDNVVINAPVHQLDASMQGSLSLSASITTTLTNITDSLKSLSSTFVYGTKLDGKALYLTSQLEEAETNDALHRRITAHGVKASPVESATATSKFGQETLKLKSEAKPSEATTFYALPLFESPQYSNGEMNYSVSGAAMKGIKSQLGLALLNRDSVKKRIGTQSVWPGAKNLIGDITADFSNGDAIYPTATLCDRTILCSPSYPDNNSVLSPVIWSGGGHGVRVICGTPIVAKASNGKTCVYVGNIITLPKSKKK